MLLELYGIFSSDTIVSVVIPGNFIEVVNETYAVLQASEGKLLFATKEYSDYSQKAAIKFKMGKEITNMYVFDRAEVVRLRPKFCEMLSKHIHDYYEKIWIDSYGCSRKVMKDSKELWEWNSRADADDEISRDSKCEEDEDEIEVNLCQPRSNIISECKCLASFITKSGDNETATLSSKLFSRCQQGTKFSNLIYKNDKFDDVPQETNYTIYIEDTVFIRDYTLHGNLCDLPKLFGFLKTEFMKRCQKKRFLPPVSTQSDKIPDFDLIVEKDVGNDDDEEDEDDEDEDDEDEDDTDYDEDEDEDEEEDYDTDYDEYEEEDDDDDGDDDDDEPSTSSSESITVCKKYLFLIFIINPTNHFLIII